MKPTPPPMRPALAWWQAVLTVTLGDLCCHRFDWFRAYIGGRWWFGTTSISGRIAKAWMHFGDTSCPNDPRYRGCDESPAGVGCECEVYPWPSLYSAQTPEDARTFEEYRKRYDRVRVVGLSRVGKSGQ